MASPLKQRQAGRRSILRGNDLIYGAVDVCVTDTLTGNVLVKVFGAYNTGGNYESLGWGYGPSVGEDWPYVISIISRGLWSLRHCKCDSFYG